jgi:hypothetical protein
LTHCLPPAGIYIGMEPTFIKPENEKKIILNEKTSFEGVG